MKKSHAKEYLSEYATGKAGWIVALVEKVISTNGDLTEQEKEQVFAQLLEGNGLTDDSLPSQLDRKGSESEAEPDNEKSTGNQLTFKKITHVSGINALMCNQSINFSDSCTVIFGLNGTGKSGYFRVINEITGATKEKNILGNVYAGDQDVEVSIEYFLDDTAHSISWDNSQRAIPPFTQAEVFDSDHLPIFLNEKESSVNIEPLGLHLFKSTTDVIDEFKGRLQDKAEHYRQQTPDISPLVQGLKSQDLVSVLNKNNLPEKDERYLKKKGLFTATDKKRLKNFAEQKSTLEKDNSSDKINVLTREASDIKGLLSHLKNVKSQINKHVDKIKPTIEKYQEKKKRRDERVKEFEALKNIPEQNSEEWQVFIDSAVEYEKQIDKSEFNSDEFCIYCHQPLKTQEALNLVKTYSKYLEDQSQREFTTSTQSLNEIDNTLESIFTDYEFPDGLVSILDSADSQLTERVNQYLKSAKDKIQELRGKIKNKDISENTFDTNSLDEIASQINSLIEGRKSTINNLRASNQDKAKKIQKLQEIIDRLSDKKLLSEWLNKVQEHFQTKKLSDKYSAVGEAFNTREVTITASKAHDELLTETIRNAFQEELQGLGKTLTVGINKTSAGKGSIRTRLEIEGKDVRSILSEGEQKAVALALFIAEIKCQDKKFPVVFDDPVTSLDHEIANNFAKQLISLSLDRQIIIFTHNILFYGYLLKSSGRASPSEQKAHHICERYSAIGCNKQGEHVFVYELKKVNGEAGMVFKKGEESLSHYLSLAKNQLDSMEDEQIIAGTLRLAVEHFIDEKILRDFELVKNSPDKSSINWKNLYKVGANKDTIDTLYNHHGTLSSRGIHSSRSSQENPLTYEELEQILNFLANN